MLIYSDDRLVPTDVNMMVISDGEGGYFYIHRSLYDQAVIINDIYSEDPTMLIKAITGEEETRPDVEFFLKEMPSPINIFGPFLLLVKEEIEEPLDMIGAIHAMSGPVNLRRMLKIPFEMRNMPSFSLSIREEYKLAWDRFFQTALPYSEDMFFRNYSGPMNGTYTDTENPQYGEGEEGEEGEDDADAAAWAMLMGEVDFSVDDDTDKDEEEDKDEAPTTKPASVTEPEAKEPEPEPKPEPPKKMTGLDALIGGMI